MTKLNVYAAVLNVTGELAFGSVCQTCEYVIANGDLPDVDDTRDQAIIEKNCQAYEFTLGHIHYGKWDDSRCYHRGFECIDDDCTCERVEFDSFNHCDMCGDSLAGYRAHVTMIKRDLLRTNMTQEQFDKLRVLCDRYNVDMAIADYFVNSQDSSIMPGWVEGWVGGDRYKAIPVQTSIQKPTIYIGVSPEGDSHS